ncbi:MAG TPA: thiaminase II [Vicinamibacteria bacterium]|nr:thiaminase II [Vicinamibacteria bacterium]
MRREGFSGELWSAAESVYRNILAHPFLTGLADGTLDVDSFRFYIVEDTYYLTEFARALSIMASKAPRDEWIVAFNRDAIGSLEAERALHESYFEEFGLSEEELRTRPPAPTTLAYTSYLLSAAQARPFGEALSAVLPCYWIYAEVGKVLLGKGSPNPLYQRWIETYGSEAYEATVVTVLDIMDEVAREEGHSSRERMRRHFVTTSRYEWMFWDMAYRQEAWPV